MRKLLLLDVVGLTPALLRHAPRLAAFAKEGFSAPVRPVLYPQVEPVFARHCAGCHDARKGDNRAAQRVFEMSRYPFSTGRPRTLLADLRRMFADRDSLSPTEKCTGITWVDGGGRDANGDKPRWRTP